MPHYKIHPEFLENRVYGEMFLQMLPRHSLCPLPFLILKVSTTSRVEPLAQEYLMSQNVDPAGTIRELSGKASEH